MFARRSREHLRATKIYTEFHSQHFGISVITCAYCVGSKYRYIHVVQLIMYFGVTTLEATGTRCYVNLFVLCESSKILQRWTP